MGRRRTIKTPSIRRKKRRIFILKCIVVAILFVGFGASIVYMSKLPAFQIKDVVVHGNTVISSEALTAAATESIQGNALMFFPRRNVFIYPRETIRKKVLDEYARIKSVNVELDGFHTVSLNIVERKPHGLWCVLIGTGRNGTHTDECYFIDDTGFVFDEAPDFTEGVYIKYYGLIDKENPIGASYIPTLKFGDLSAFITRLKNLGVEPHYVESRKEGEYDVAFDGGGVITFSSSRSLDTIYTNFEAALGEIRRVAGREGISAVDYIDLRYGNKVYYKLKEAQ